MTPMPTPTPDPGPRSAHDANAPARARRERGRARREGSGSLPALASVLVHLVLGAAFVRWGLAVPDHPPLATVRAAPAARATSGTMRVLPLTDRDSAPPPPTASSLPVDVPPPPEPPDLRDVDLPPPPLLPPLAPVEEPPSPEDWPTRPPAPDLDAPAAPPPSEAPEPDDVADAPMAETATVLAPEPASTNAPPEYPTASRRAREEGTVLVELEIDADGLVRTARVLESSGHAALDEAALTAARAWTFQPAREDGVAVDGTLRLPISFRLRR